MYPIERVEALNVESIAPKPVTQHVAPRETGGRFFMRPGPDRVPRQPRG